MNNKKVRKAVIAAAGLGTRFLPQTKAFPKEMLPIVDKPVIQYIVEELVEAGIEDIILVTGYHKRAIEDHFDLPSAELVDKLTKSGKTKELELVNAVSNLANFIYIRQKGHHGNGTPVLNAEHIVGNEPFIYTFADDFFMASPSRFQQMVELYNQTGASVASCIRANKPEDYDRYGYASGVKVGDGIYDLQSIIEKPGKDNAPSDVASVSGYLFTPEIFSYLNKAYKEFDPAGGEFTTHDSTQQMINDGLPFKALEIKNGKYYDSGSKLEYIKTVVDFALKDSSMSEDLKEYLKKLVI